jgi:hypothetical protein
MKLKTISIEGKGDLNKEVVWLEAVEQCSIHYYIVSDTTYTDGSHISNELRHIFWFPPKDIAKGDLIALWTKVGSSSSVANNRHTTTHNFYWNLGRTVWNKDGDCAVLFELADWNTTRA